ncbi:MAG: hypothetical protein ABSG51_01535, partial [Terracidiphilus sp.]
MTEPTSNCDGNESLVAARSDLFDRLPTSALSRIMRFLDYNPIIPINDFSVETKPWKALPQLRQRQWLDTHRGDIWKEFVQAGTPTSQYLLNGPWSYGSILAAILKHLSGDLPAGDALCVELQILERIWRELPRHLPSGLLGQALCELGAYLGITGGIEQVKASIDTQLRNQLRDPRKLIQKPVSLSCAVILSLINQKYLDIARLSASKPVQSLLTIVVDGVRGVVEDP